MGPLTALSRQLAVMGVDFRRFFASVRGLPKFYRDWRTYRAAGTGLPLSAAEMLPMLSDYQGQAGSANGHYWFQDMWAAKKILKRRPAKHVDIGSRLDGFVTHLLTADMPVVYVDILPLQTKTAGLSFFQDDATELKRFPDNSVESLSSLHAAEHFGLGRYSDPIDPLAHLKFMSALQRVLARDGRLYFAVPIGRERVRFNGHRILAASTVTSQFSQLRLLSFSYVDDEGELVENVAVGAAPALMHYGCGLFEFTKD